MDDRFKKRQIANIFHAILDEIQLNETYMSV